MPRHPISMEQMRRNPAGEGARALEPIIEWYAAYKCIWGTHENAAQYMAAARDWLLMMLNGTLDVEDAIDPIAPGKAGRKR